jgi:hypothetical protein
VSSNDNTRVGRYLAQLDRQRETLAAELEDEIAPLRHLSMAERGRWIASVCRSAWAILRARPDMRAAIDRDEPPAVDFELLWRRLRTRQHPDSLRASG